MKLLKVITTIDSEEKAINLAELSVKNKLCACAQIIGPITSIYTWKNKLEKDKEWIILFKTQVSLKEKLVQFIKENHSYEVPEIITIEVNSENPDYSDWVKEVTLSS
ncbi:MAG: divalent-cation tolerance protein CutA [Thermodesulfobacteria bacterium]|nr:divalent-cation tolerance protein CutA [Thermodesulfobacteriota bacterium]